MDTDLVTRAQGGDEGAFVSLAVAVGDRLHAVAHRILRDTDLAEDATQQALLAIWQDLPQLRDPARFEWKLRSTVRASPLPGMSPSLKQSSSRSKSKLPDRVSTRGRRRV